MAKIILPLDQRPHLSQYELLKDAKTERKLFNDSLRDASKVLSLGLDFLQSRSPTTMRDPLPRKQQQDKSQAYVPFIIEPVEKVKERRVPFDGVKPVTTNLFELDGGPVQNKAELTPISSRRQSGTPTYSEKPLSKAAVWASEASCSDHLLGMKQCFDTYLAKAAKKVSIYMLPPGVYADPHDYSEFYAADKIDAFQVFKEDTLSEKKASESLHVGEETGEKKSISEIELENQPLGLPIEESVNDDKVEQSVEPKLPESELAGSPVTRSRFSSKELSRGSQPMSMKSVSKHKKSIYSSKMSKKSRAKTSHFGQPQEISPEPIIEAPNGLHQLEDKAMSIDAISSVHQSKRLSSLEFIEKNKLDLIAEPKQDNDLNLSKLSHDMSMSVMITSQISENNQIVTHQDLHQQASPNQRLLRKTTTTEFTVKRGFVRNSPEVVLLRKLNSATLDEQEEEADFQDVYGSPEKKPRENRIPFHAFNFHPRDVWAGGDFPPFSNSY